MTASEAAVVPLGNHLIIWAKHGESRDRPHRSPLTRGPGVDEPCTPTSGRCRVTSCRRGRRLRLLVLIGSVESEHTASGPRRTHGEVAGIGTLHHCIENAAGCNYNAQSRAWGVEGPVPIGARGNLVFRSKLLSRMT